MQIAVIQDTRRSLCDDCDNCVVVRAAGTSPEIVDDWCYCKLVAPENRRTCRWAASLRDPSARCPDRSEPEKQARWQLAALDTQPRGCNGQPVARMDTIQASESASGQSQRRGVNAKFYVYQNAAGEPSEK